MPGPFDDLIPASRSSAPPAFIPGTPKTRDPLDDASKNQALINQQQALINAQLEEENKRLKNKAEENRFNATGGVDGTEGENKAAALTTNLQSAMNNIRAVTKADPSAAKPGLLELGAGMFGEDAKEYVQSSERRDVAGSQFIAVDSALTLATGAAYTPSQLEGYTRSLFPTLNDTPSNIASKRRKFEQIIQAGRLQAGAKAPNIEQAIAAVDAIYGPVDGANEDENPNVAPGMRQGPTDGLPEDVDPKDIEYIERDPSGKVTGYQLKDGSPFVALFDSGNARERDEKVKAVADAQDLREGSAGFGVKADSGVLSGLSDEVQGIGGAIGSALRLQNPVEGYKFSRDVARERYDRASEATGVAGDVLEIGASLAIPFGAANGVRQTAKVGAVAGTVGGFGYGEGAEGSGLGAAIGAPAGAILGAGGAKIGNALANRASSKATQTNNRNALLGAADDLGMSTPARMFTEPALQNKTRAVAGTLAGGSRVQKGVQDFGNEVEDAVLNNLSKGGQALERPTVGTTAQQAFTRTDNAKKTQTDRLYDSYRKASGDPPVIPQGAIAKLDAEIAELNRSPSTNKTEIAFLQSYRDDFANGKMTVETLRNMRTNLRGQINEKNLSASKAEGRIQGALEAAGDDIAKALDPSSKGYALLTRANKSHADRMVYKKQLQADLIGKDKDLPTDPGKAFETIMTWTNPKGDLRKLKALQQSFTPEEYADFSATIANSISKDNNGNFSTAILLSSIEKMERAGKDTIVTLFGQDGAKALQNIKLVAAEHKRVNGAIAGQGSAIANDWRSILGSIFVPLAAGVAGGGGVSTTAAAMGATGFVIKAGRDAMSAKMLLSPKVTGWVRSAPKSASPKAIDAHFAKLGAIAKAEPALAADIEAFRSAILQAANDNTSRAVAQDGEGERGR